MFKLIRIRTKIKNHLKGVSVGPVIIYGMNGESSRFIQEVSEYGASTIDSEVKGITHLNLSEEIDFHKSLELSKEISCEFMSAKDFFDLKSFSYFSRDYKYSNFLNDIELVTQEEVSFKL